MTQSCITEKSSVTLFHVMPEWRETACVSRIQDYEMAFSLAQVTPELAYKLLETQQSNRKLNLNRVNEYARRMSDNEWVLSEPAKFDVDGHLIDAQHRLHAIIKSGETVTMPLLVGYPKDSQLVLDIGMARGIAQIAQIQGVNLSTNHVSMIRALFLLVPGAGGGGGKSELTSPKFIIDLYMKHQEAIDFALQSYGNKPIKFAPVRSVVARAWAHENHQILKRFLEVFDTGFADGASEYAAVALRNYYLGFDNRGGGGNTIRADFAKKAVSALEAFLAGRELKSVRGKSTCRWKLSGVD